MEALSSYRVAYLLTLGFFVLGIGSWLLYLTSGSWIGPAVVFFAMGLWAGLLEAHVVQRGKLSHAVGSSVLLMLGPVLLAISDLAGRSLSGEVIGMELFVRGALAAVVLCALLALLIQMVLVFTVGLDRYLEQA